MTVCKIRKKIDKKFNKINSDNIMSNTGKMSSIKCYICKTDKNINYDIDDMKVCRKCYIDDYEEKQIQYTENIHNYKYDEIDAGIPDSDFIDIDDEHIACFLLEYY
jgi:hypothetical protein